MKVPIENMSQTLSQNQLRSRIAWESISGIMLFAGFFIIYDISLSGLETVDIVSGILFETVLGISLIYLSYITDLGQTVRTHVERHWWQKIVFGVVAGRIIAFVVGYLLNTAVYLTLLIAWCVHVLFLFSVYINV